MPAPLAPGAVWTQGGATVRNYGSSWLDVSTSGSGVSIAPGAPPPYQDEDGVWQTPWDPYAGNYAFNATAANASWSGTAVSLNATTSGNFVGPISVSGSLYVHAGGNVDSLTAQSVTAWAGGNLGDVTANDRVVKASAAGSIGDVTAPNGVDWVEAGGNVGDVSSAANVGRVRAGGDLESMTAGGWIATVNVAGSILEDVAASGDIGGRPTLDPGNTGYGSYSYYAWVGAGATAGGNIAGSIVSGGNIARVQAGGQLLGDVSAPGDIWTVAAATLEGSVTAGRDVYQGAEKLWFFGGFCATVGRPHSGDGPCAARTIPNLPSSTASASKIASGPTTHSATSSDAPTASSPT